MMVRRVSWEQSVMISVLISRRARRWQGQGPSTKLAEAGTYSATPGFCRLALTCHPFTTQSSSANPDSSLESFLPSVLCAACGGYCCSESGGLLPTTSLALFYSRFTQEPAKHRFGIRQRLASDD